MATPDQILEQAIALKPVEQAKLIDRLIAILDVPDPENDQLWVEESKSRLDAYRQGRLEALSLEEVLARYR